MQNKGFVKIFAVLLAVVCLFYLSFSFVTAYHSSKAKQYAQGEMAYLDSMNSETVWLGIYSLKQCREMEIGLGLDLKGGMNVILEVSIPDVVKAISDYNQDETFNRALAVAKKKSVTSQDDFIALFTEEYKKLVVAQELEALASEEGMSESEKNAKAQSIYEKKYVALFPADRLSTNTSVVPSTVAEVQKLLRTEVDAAVANAKHVLRTRIDHFGVAQPNIQEVSGNQGRIMIELPGVKEPERVRKMLQGSANLEFWETYNAAEIVPYLGMADARLRENLRAAEAPQADEAAEGEDVEEAAAPAEEPAAQGEGVDLSIDDAAPQGADEATLEQFKREHPLAAVLQFNTSGNGCIVGYAHYRDTAQVNALLSDPEVKNLLPMDLRLYWGVKAADFDKTAQIFELYAIKSTTDNGRARLEGNAISSASAGYDQFQRPCVNMTMNSTAAEEWRQITKENIGKCVAVVLDGYVYSAPNVNSEIAGGRSEITGNFTVEATQDLANVLNSGKMPVPARIVQEDVVGPSLGQASINQGIVSFIVAFVLLMLYMCAIYGWIPGAIANGALLLNLFFTLGILASFQAALTMSGIAGIVLTLGMAVDANVLIYERTKEELRAGKQLRAALTDGYKNAFSAIFDSNFTSIITGIILFYFGTGPIRGFATTLIIGVLCSFFTAVFVTRLVYEHFMNKGKLLNLTFVTSYSKKLMVQTKYNFMGARNRSFLIFGIGMAVCLVSFALRGLSQSIDFTGGSNYVVQFEKQVEPETVRALLKTKIVEDNVQAIALGTDHKTIRITTNYRITDDSPTVDAEVEQFLFEALKEGGLLSESLTLETFIDRDNTAGGSIISSQKVGPNIAEDIKVDAIWSVIYALVAIFLYILLRFRNVAYSVGSIVALLIDTTLIIGMYSICYGWLPMTLEVDQTFIGAVLTAIGYSINDKVVIFDRIREFIGLYPKRDKMQLFNDSLNTTLARTLNTSFSTLIVLLCIFILGGDSIRSFSFAMILGVLFGTCSSLFIAVPVAYLTLSKGENKKQ